MAEEDVKTEEEEEEVDEFDYYEDEDEEDDESPSMSVEDLAREMGWVPKDEYTRGEDSWVNAAEFIKKGNELHHKFRDDVKSLRKQNADMLKGVEDVKKHVRRTYEAENRRLRDELEGLKAQKLEAIEDADPDRVAQIEEKMEAIQKKEVPVEEEVPSNPDFDEWYESGGKDWYKVDPEKTAYADEQAQLPEHRGLSFKKLIKVIESRMAKVFPDHEPYTKRPNSPVESPSRKTGGKRFAVSDLTSEEKRSMRNFVDLGLMTQKEYLEGVARERGVIS